jgi:hypothetical protein
MYFLPTLSFRKNTVKKPDNLYEAVCRVEEKLSIQALRWRDSARYISIK